MPTRHANEKIKLFFMLEIGMTKIAFLDIHRDPFCKKSMTA